MELTREQAMSRRAAEDRLKPLRENAREALNTWVAELGGAIVLAERRGDEDDRRQHAASLTQVRSAQRVLWMD